MKFEAMPLGVYVRIVPGGKCLTLQTRNSERLELSGPRSFKPYEALDIPSFKSAGRNLHRIHLPCTEHGVHNALSL